MRITKFVHSCLLVQMPAPISRSVLFDPGAMSEAALDIGKLDYLDDIVITHIHPDHLSLNLLKQAVAKFPNVRITAPAAVVTHLSAQQIVASSKPAPGMVFFDSPHEDVSPMYPHPEQIGVHYLGMLSDPGDSHSFTETKAILALPMTGPWGNAIRALNLALELKPKYVLPIHDWHWRDEAREQTYDTFERILGDQGIIFLKLQTGQPAVINT